MVGISRKCSGFYDRSQCSPRDKAVPSSGGKRSGIQWVNPDCEPAQVLPGSGADSESMRRQEYANTVFLDLRGFIVSQEWSQRGGKLEEEVGEGEENERETLKALAMFRREIIRCQI